MNKNSYFETMIYPPISLGYNEMPQKKEKNMEHYKEFPFSINWESYKTLDEATKAARKYVMNSKEDVVIKQNVAIVKFPVPDYEVETLST